MTKLDAHDVIFFSHEDYSDILNHFLDTIEHLDIYLTKKILPGSSLFSEIMSQEREMSSYQNLIKIIKILGSCCKKYHSVLMPCLESVFSEIFGPHLRLVSKCLCSYFGHHCPSQIRNPFKLEIFMYIPEN